MSNRIILADLRNENLTSLTLSEFNEESHLKKAEFNCDFILNSAKFLCDRWQKLYSRYLPVTGKDSIWLYSRHPSANDPEQGWKLHVSATILSASDLFESVASFLQNHCALFKAPSSLQELGKINSGVEYGYSQIGKFITVYPQSDKEAVFFAENLNRLTRGIPAPIVPFDLRYNPGSCVYYRYGSFKSQEKENPDGTRIPAIVDPEGNFVPDFRDTDTAFPNWAANPFPSRKPEPAESALKKNFLVFRALVQRGKGGVYQALDLNANPPRLCLLKEGRRNGETCWDGDDGYRRIQNESRVLEVLHKAGVIVPKIYVAFESGENFYLATEFIAGDNFYEFLRKKRRRLSISKAIEFAIQISDLLTQIHSLGWSWRDCKPHNFIVTENNVLRPVDFEGACPINQLNLMPWSTPLFSRGELIEKISSQSSIEADLYALGVNIYFLFEGRLPEKTSHSTLEHTRRNLPPLVRSIIKNLLSPNPAAVRPTSQSVSKSLRAIRY